VPAPSAEAGAKPPAFLSATAWTVRKQSIFGGQFATAAGDPSVVRDGSGLTMAYTCYDPVRKGSETCIARSPDGITWTDDPAAAGLDGRALVAAAGSWHEAHETPELVDAPSGRRLFFVGYVSQSFFGAGGNVSMGRAPVSGAAPYALDPTTPVWKPTAGAADAYGMTSPSIEIVGGDLRMVYTGWTSTFATTLLAATSTDDGVTWKNHGTPLVDPTTLPSFAKKGIAETCLRTGPDGKHYLFFESIDEPHRIGVAVANDWLGPYTFAPEPIVMPEQLDDWAKTGLLAPHVLFDGGRVRLWFSALEPGKGFEIGYAEASFD
jgi:predicted GH43/DUF377 family glycosyl hydrolase